MKGFDVELISQCTLMNFKRSIYRNPQMISQCVYKTNLHTQTHTDNNGRQQPRNPKRYCWFRHSLRTTGEWRRKRAFSRSSPYTGAASRGFKIQVSVAEPPPPARREIFGASKNLGQNGGEKPTEPELNSAPSCVPAQRRRRETQDNQVTAGRVGTRNSHLLLLRGSEIVEAHIMQVLKYSFSTQSCSGEALNSFFFPSSENSIFNRLFTESCIKKRQTLDGCLLLKLLLSLALHMTGSFRGQSQQLALAAADDRPARPHQ